MGKSHFQHQSFDEKAACNGALTVVHSLQASERPLYELSGLADGLLIFFQLHLTEVNYSQLGLNDLIQKLMVVYS